MALTGAQVRQSFIDFFKERGHTFVPSASLVPGGDSTLLFTNAGMVQFKDVFLGLDKRPYNRAVNSQKCMRVSGKHNDLDEVGRDNTHHTFFEMLGNWSFGDYYKQEALTWYWQLLTEVWQLPKDKLWATYFKDDKGTIPEDSEAKEAWLSQPGFDPAHLVAYGRKDNFWEMADTGPCGPCSEVHFDFGPDACRMKDDPNHVCHINAGCGRWTELGNNVFIQYNRLSENELVPLPQKHVDTGMGLERVVSVIQRVHGNYETDLLSPLLDKVQQISGHSLTERKASLTPYRVIADHVRAASFLIADGVIPGNIGRNYICRMIIRRAARFARKLNLTKPFMAEVSQVVIDNYGDAYSELKRHSKTIQETITREEERFAETLDSGFSALNLLMDELKLNNKKILDGYKAFDLYATLGFPLEITRDILREEGFEVDETGFHAAMEEHRLASGAGKAFGEMSTEGVEVYQSVFEQLVKEEKLPADGVLYDPYGTLHTSGTVLAIFKDGQSIKNAHPDDQVEILLPQTCFYLESGGQVSDAGLIQSDPVGNWTVKVDEVRKPAAGVIIHIGKVLSGQPNVGDAAIAQVDEVKRNNTMRNHTATHLLHAALHKVLGTHARQAGSLVAPDRLRFDFNHPKAVTKAELLQIEAEVNHAIMSHHDLKTVVKPLDEAIAEGAMALFGEKYGASVRTISIGEKETLSYELCGGTHVHNTADIGLFLITFEGSIASGVRRIEAVTGTKAYNYARERMNALDLTAQMLTTSSLEVPIKINQILDSLKTAQDENNSLRSQLAREKFDSIMAQIPKIEGIPVLMAIIPNANTEVLRELSDRFRQKNNSGVVVLGSVIDDKPILVASVTQDLIARGLHAGKLIKEIAAVVEGGGGGKPDMAQAGGKNPAKLSEALDKINQYIKENLKG